MEDTEEAPHVYSLLCELAASGHPALATPDAPRHVIAVLAEAFLRDAVPTDNPAYVQMVQLVRQIQVHHIVITLSYIFIAILFRPIIKHRPLRSMSRIAIFDLIITSHGTSTAVHRPLGLPKLVVVGALHSTGTAANIQNLTPAVYSFKMRYFSKKKHLIFLY